MFILFLSMIMTPLPLSGFKIIMSLSLRRDFQEEFQIIKSLRNDNDIIILFLTSIVGLERFCVFMKTISYWCEFKPIGTICVTPVPQISEIDSSVFFKPVSCKLIQGFVWEAAKSCAGLTFDQSHVNRVLENNCISLYFIKIGKYSMV